MDWDAIKSFLVPIIVRWILKVGAGVVGTLGVTTGSSTEIITAIVMFVVGAIISLINHTSAVKQAPPKP